MIPRPLSGSRYYLILQSYLAKIDWKLLLLLLLFLNVKLYIKLAALLIVYVARPDFKFGWKLRSPKLPLFYPAMMLLAAVNFLTRSSHWGINTTFLLLVGLSYWAICILVFHQIRLSVEKADTDRIHRTIATFFVINAIISFAQYFYCALSVGVLNLYQYQGAFQKYFLGTGDMIRGSSFDVSISNALICSMGVVYAICRQQFRLSLLCMTVLLMTGSNLTNMALIAVFVFLLLFKSNKTQKSLIVTSLALLVVFVGNISPQNNDYAVSVLQKLFVAPPPPPAPETTPGVQVVAVSNVASSVPTLDEKRTLIAKMYIDSVRTANLERLKRYNGLRRKGPNLAILKKDNHSASFQRMLDTSKAQKALMAAAADPTNLPFSVMAEGNEELRSKPGKVLAFSQTVDLLKSDWRTAITGVGMGHFSSRLAIRATALNIAGGYPASYKYIDPYFQANHLSLYLYYFSRDASLHSVMNAPNSVYNQVLSEYGLLGIFAFLLLYFGFFARHYKRLTYGIPVLLLLAASFAWEYWFEQLSVVVLAELLLLLNIKERSTVSDNTI